MRLGVEPSRSALQADALPFGQHIMILEPHSGVEPASPVYKSGASPTMLVRPKTGGSGWGRTSALRVMSPLLCHTELPNQNILAPPAGFEPASARVEAAYSDPLSYRGRWCDACESNADAIRFKRTRYSDAGTARGPALAVPFSVAIRWCAARDSNSEAERFELSRFADYRQQHVVDLARRRGFEPLIFGSTIRCIWPAMLTPQKTAASEAAAKPNSQTCHTPPS
jgi:hypothetical protein